MEELTTSQAGYTQDQIIRIILSEIISKGGVASIQDIYAAVNTELAKKNVTLSVQGQNSIRRLVNYTAVNARYIYQHDEANPGWRITPEGREFIDLYQEGETETVFDIETQKNKRVVSNVTLSSAFEHFCIALLTKIYPYYTWYHQGRHKKTERGLDIIGERLGDSNGEPVTYGVQVKLHQSNSSPTKEEWLKFQAGCFVRNIDKAIFITTGKLNGEQRREAGEGQIKVIEGQEAINRLCDLYELERFNFID